MSTEIKEQHKSIFSMYYHSLDPGAIKRPVATIDLDLQELLLLMDTVFDCIHYKIDINEDGDSSIVHIPKEYDNLISESEILSKYGVLKNEYLEDFDEDDYKKSIVNDSEKLFCYNVLTTFINYDHKLQDRKSLAYFLLYNKDGKQLIKYLFNRLKDLICRICNPESYGDPVVLIKSMIKDYDDLESLFEDVHNEINIINMRSNNIADSFKPEFTNENQALQTWTKGLTDKSKDSHKTVIEFFYKDSPFSKAQINYVLELVYQITMIATESGYEQFTDNWSKYIADYDHKANRPREMELVNKLLTEYRHRDSNGEFSKDTWGIDYNNHLDKVSKCLGI